MMVNVSMVDSSKLQTHTRAVVMMMMMVNVSMVDSSKVLCSL